MYKFGIVMFFVEKKEEEKKILPTVGIEPTIAPSLEINYTSGVPYHLAK